MPRRNRREPARATLNLQRTRATGICPNGKMIFPDKETGELALADARRTRIRRKPKRVVRCDWCQGWHLTGDGKRT